MLFIARFRVDGAQPARVDGLDADWVGMLVFQRFGSMTTPAGPSPTYSCCYVAAASTNAPPSPEMPMPPKNSLPPANELQRHHNAAPNTNKTATPPSPPSADAPAPKH